MLQKYFLWILEASFMVSIITMALKLLSPILKRYYSANLRCLIWILLTVRLVIPFPVLQLESVQRSIPSTAVLEFEESKLKNASVPLDPKILQQEAVRKGSLAWSDIFLIVWGTGAFVYLLLSFVGNYAFKKKIWRWNRPIEDQMIMDCIHMYSSQMKITGKVPAFLNDMVVSPMMIGFFQPTMLLPEAEYTKAELSFIIQHELIHFKRHDLWYKLLLAAVNALHWFNPIIYLMVQEANRDLELACDDRVVKGRSMEERIAYSETILRSMYLGKMKPGILNTYFYGGTKTMKDRFKNIFSGSKKRCGKFLAAAVIMVILLSGLSVEFTQAKGSVKTDIDNIILNVTDCNVIVKTSNSIVIHSSFGMDGFGYQIDERIHKITTSQDENTITINLRSTGDTADTKTDMAILFIPDQEYHRVTVTGEKAGISLPPINADISMSGSDSAMSLGITEGFEKTVHYTMKNGSGSFVLSPLTDHYSLNMDSQESVVSVLPQMPEYKFQTNYKYVSGNGKAVIDLNLENSAFSIVQSDMYDKTIDTVIIKDKVYYNIYSENDLRLIGTPEYPLHANYMLQCDIDLEKEWVPIGGSEAAPFTGTFTGNGFTIRNISIDDKDGKYKYLGFFGLVEGGTIHNVTLENVSINTARKTDVVVAPKGNVAAVVLNGNMTDCYVK